MEKLIMDLVSKITDEHSESILQLALVLERNTLIISNHSSYILNLPPQLLDVVLTLDDQREIVDSISQRIMSGAGNRSELFWVIGKAARVALIPLITLLKAQPQTFDEETAWQALIALENCLELDDDEDSSRLINEANLRSIIQQMAKLNISTLGDPRNARLAEIVQRILRRTEARADKIILRFKRGIMTESILIRPVVREDFDAWKVLWDGYNAFYEREGPTALPLEITQMTWSRFFDAYEPVHALVAEESGVLLGLVHYIFHRSTIQIEPTCYLQDLFTAEAARGKGIGRALIEAVYERAAVAGTKRVYWHTHETNTTAQYLYNKVADKSGFIVYRKTL